MKRLFALLGLLACMGSAQASSLYIDDQTGVAFRGYDGQPLAVTGAYSTGFLGTLKSSSAGIFSVTYLGQESGYSDLFRFLEIGGLQLTESDALGSTISMDVAAGTLDFRFLDSQGGSVINGAAATDYSSFAILAGKCINHSGKDYGCFDYILGFNDGYTHDADFDDFVVGVNLSPVPLPAAAWLFGSALIGFVSLKKRRRC